MKATAKEHLEAAVLALQNNDVRRGSTLIEQALLIDPALGPAWAFRCQALYDSGDYFNALVAIDRAISMLPKHPSLLTNRANCLFECGQHDKALAVLDDALALNPDHPQAVRTKGYQLYIAGRYEEAYEVDQHAIRLFPDDAECVLDSAFPLLAQGKMADGWAAYNHRPIKNHPAAYKKWDGSPPHGRILVYGEQGLGDVIQFMRYAKLLQEKIKQPVTLEVRRPLLRLAKTMEGIDEVIALGDDRPKCEYAVPLMSLPHLLAAPVYHQAPYISADKSRWGPLVRAELRPNNLRVGLCWAGQARDRLRRNITNDAKRSLPLEAFAPLAQIPNCTFVSLQTGTPADQCWNAPPGMMLHFWTEMLEDFQETANFITHLDVVIAVDTATAHLAAALGKPTWILHRRDNCWRWQGDRKDSPWYQDVTNFRQPTFGNWPAVMAKVSESLWHLQNKPRLLTA